MSGTSQDGIDAVLAEFVDGQFDRVIGHQTGHYRAGLRDELVDLSREATAVTLARYATLDRDVADAFADAALSLLREFEPGSVRAIGSHGQTVFHDPTIARSSLQLGDPGRIAVRTGLPVVADFRRADVALGGQGAPLVPAFHQAVFATDDEPRAVLNLGGIANLTVLPDADPDHARGFDCGPASCLMDEWIGRHRGLRFDDDGAWASSGLVKQALLALALSDPYFAAPAPKSSGRGYFNLDWLARISASTSEPSEPADVQRTLCELTARSVADALRAHAPGTTRLFACGGGVRNGFLLARLRHLLPDVTVQTTAMLGLDPQWVEGAAFAWLAARRLRGEPGNLPSVTGASRRVPLGGVYLP